MQILASVRPVWRSRIRMAAPSGSEVRYVDPASLFDILRKDGRYTVVLEPDGLHPNFVFKVARAAEHAGARMMLYASLQRDLAALLCSFPDQSVPTLLLADTDDTVEFLRAELALATDSVPTRLLRNLAPRLARLRPALSSPAVSLFAWAPISANSRRLRFAGWSE